MRKYFFYNHTDSVMLPNGIELTPKEFGEKYPISKTSKCIIVRTGGVITNIDNLGLLRGNYDIDDSLNDEQALIELNKILEAEKEAQSSQVNETSINDAILAQLEYQSAMMTPIG